MRALARLMTVPTAKRDDRWLEEGLQAAIQLEMSTIPPYLYAAWSIDASAPDPSGCQQVIIGIAVEEMRHMGIACNLLASIGGRPRIVQLAPTYPTQLPKHIHEGLPVALAPLSRDLLLKTFMVIEEPAAHVVDDPDFVPSGATLIGQFYGELQQAFEARSPAFSTAGQVDLGGFFGPPSLITSLTDVRDGIDLIKRQGEGTAAAPFENSESPDELAHFYQFGELFHGHRLTRTSPFTYTGDVVELPAARMVSPADDTLQESKDFNQAYSDMLRALQRAWEGGGVAALGDAVGQMFSLGAAAEDLIRKGFGPAFVVVDRSGGLVPPPTVGNRFAHVKEILDAAVGRLVAFGAHGPFWRDLTRDQFVQHAVFGRPLLVVGNGGDSNLVKALRGQLPFGKDTGAAGATFRRMPAGLDPVAPADIDFIEQWINDGCPDAAPVVSEANVSLTTGAFRPDPLVHVAFFRDLDDLSPLHPTAEVRQATDLVASSFEPWVAFARDAASKLAWTGSLSSEAIRQAVTTLSARHKQTVEAHYGTPVPLLTVLDGYERFGNDGLPDDPLRPGDPRRNMRDPITWFSSSALAEACIRLGISPEFWLFLMRAILCGLLNDGLFRGRFPVQGFTATPEGRLAVFQHAQDVADAELPDELRRRFVESELAP